MGRWKIGSLTAALGCIALGVVLALIQYGTLTYAALGLLWPALLILLGLEMLMRLLLKSENKTRVSGWAIVLIVLLGCASAGQSALLGGGTLDTLLGRSNLAPVNGSVSIGDNIKAVRISIPQGKVKVNGVQETALRYEGRLRFPGSSPSESERAIKETWKVTTEGDTVVLELAAGRTWLSGLFYGLGGGAPYLNVSLPANLAVMIETSDGTLDASELAGGIDASTSNGRIEMREIKGGVTVSTSNGALNLRNVEGGTRATSSNGSITLEDIAGEVYAKSSNGKIMIDSPITGDWDCTTSNGSISLKLPGSTNATIEADTSNGSLKGSVTWRKEDDNRGTAVLGNGEHEVELSTTNGSVSADIAE